MDASQSWIDPAVFRKAKKRKAIRKIYRVLEEEFPEELGAWDDGKRKLFKDRLGEVLNKRRGGHRAQLRAMLGKLRDEVGMRYEEEEIEVANEVRTTVFHGTGVAGWEDVLVVLDLLERALLAVVGYAGNSVSVVDG